MTHGDPDTALEAEVDRLWTAGWRSEAVDALRAGLERGSGTMSLWLKLSAMLYRERRFDEALEANAAAERADPLSARFQAIQRHMQARAFDTAEALARAMLDTVPGHPRAVFTLAHLAQARGDFEAAARILEAGLETGPANGMLRALHVGALEQSGDYAAALDAARRRAELEDGFEALFGLITLLLRYGRNEDALAACERAARRAGADTRKQSAVNLVRGQVLRILGEREPALRALRDSLTQDASNAEAWWGLADMKTVAFTDEDRSAMTALADHPGLDARRRSAAAFALARATEIRDGPAAAFDMYRRANALSPASRFDAARFKAGVERLIASFTPAALAVRAAPPPGAQRPIFIVGLPRSGSTLVEQILATHSAVAGTMEQPTLPAVKRKAHRLCVERLNADYLSGVSKLDAEALGGLGARYLEEAAVFGAEGAPVFTDKMPYNFEHVGLIEKILPHAVIIDVRRHPLDCGWSLFKQHFAQGGEFSYRLEDIAAYFNGYLQIMDHWDAVLPGRVLHVQHESLVTDPEREVRAMLTHAGLAFEPECLSFHKTRRAVRTASSEQVRQPLNRRGVGAWRAVEDELEPLKAALGEATLARFDATP